MEQKSNGAMISAVVIIILLIIGGIFFWKTNIKDKSTDQPNISETSSSADVSSDISSLEGDLDSMNLDNLDSDL